MYNRKQCYEPYHHKLNMHQRGELGFGSVCKRLVDAEVKKESKPRSPKHYEPKRLEVSINRPKMSVDTLLGTLVAQQDTERKKQKRSAHPCSCRENMYVKYSLYQYRCLLGLFIISSGLTPVHSRIVSRSSCESAASGCTFTYVPRGMASPTATNIISLSLFFFFSS